MRAEHGQIDADLGSGVIKQRIARLGAGRSQGYRSIILFRQSERAFFVYGYAKSDLGNIRDDEAEQFKKMTRQVRALTDAQLQQLIATDKFEEIVKDV